VVVIGYSMNSRLLKVWHQARRGEYRLAVLTEGLLMRNPRFGSGKRLCGAIQGISSTTLQKLVNGPASMARINCLSLLP
jgi:hypothetical protein